MTRSAPRQGRGNRAAGKLNQLSKGGSGCPLPDQMGITMKAVYIRLLCAILLLATLTVATTARAAKPAPVYADIVITFAGQSFGFAGPLRYFDISDEGGRIGFDLATLESQGYAPRPDIDAEALRMAGNRWQIVAFGGRSPEIFSGTCAVESFATNESGARVQHIYLNCADLDV
jgi:hypothetical protein